MLIHAIATIVYDLASRRTSPRADSQRWWLWLCQAFSVLVMLITASLAFALLFTPAK